MCENLEGVCRGLFQDILAFAWRAQGMLKDLSLRLISNKAALPTRHLPATNLVFAIPHNAFSVKCHTVLMPTGRTNTTSFSIILQTAEQSIISSLPTCVTQHTWAAAEDLHIPGTNVHESRKGSEISQQIFRIL
jgi:hypothetical protein